MFLLFLFSLAVIFIILIGFSICCFFVYSKKKTSSTKVNIEGDIEEKKKDEEKPIEEEYFLEDCDSPNLLAATNSKLITNIIKLDCQRDKFINMNTTLSADEKKRLAIHESSHGFLAFLLNIGVVKVTLKPEPPLLGYTVLDFGVKCLWLQIDFDNLMVLELAGRAAEEHSLGAPSTLSASDIEHLKETNYRRSRIFGLSNNLALCAIKELSEEDKKIQSNKDKENVEECFRKAKELIKENPDAINMFSDILLQREELSGPELLDALRRANEYGLHVKNSKKE
ncbi:hypothetical protein ACQ4LE_009531 [Meloidogyne hapla]